ncbi:SCO6745 family protein [Streptomyces hawaiiensis]|uniref:SCO6745 family protein n=1 Tax=Streptomyces hawaiiensis TaxID=67305 RepID=UPI00365DA298
MSDLQRMEIFDCIAAVARPIHDFGDEFMSDEATAAVGLRAGFSPGRGFYCRGRFGVLGEASVEVVQAVQGFLGPRLVAAGWLAGRPVMPAGEAAGWYARALWTWGHAHIPAEVDVEHFNRLAQQLIDAADADALPLFAGWRAQPCPADDPVGAAMQRIHVLREHRGACHLAAVRLCGLSAREAMVINLGVGQATHYGWPEPHPVAETPTAETLTTRWQRAEHLTDELQAPLYATLSGRHRTEFARLVGALTATPAP